MPRVKVQENLTNAEACEIEIALIAAIGREKDGGPLVNLVAGGEGLCDPSPETRERMRAAQTGKKQTPEHIANAAATRIGRKKTAEAREKIGAAHRGKVVSGETRRRMSEARIGKDCLTDEGRARLAAFSRARNLDPEFQEKVAAGRAAMSPEAKAALGKAISDAKKGKPMSIEQRRWISENQKGKKRGPCTDERKAAISAAKKGRPMSDEHRAALKAAWVLRRARTEKNQELENAA